MKNKSIKNLKPVQHPETKRELKPLAFAEPSAQTIQDFRLIV